MLLRWEQGKLKLIKIDMSYIGEFITIEIYLCVSIEFIFVW